MIKRKLAIAFLVISILGSLYAATIGDTVVGGQFQFIYLDQMAGNHAKDSGYSANTSAYSTFMLPDTYIKIAKQLNSWISFKLKLRYTALTGATPSAITDVGSGFLGAGSAVALYGFTEDYLSMKLPAGYELNIGALRPKLTWDYGDNMADNEVIRYGQFTDPFLFMIDDNGMELNNTYDIGGVSVPASFYILNGMNVTSANNPTSVPTLAGDNLNSRLAWAVRVQPQISGVKLTGALYVNNAGGSYNLAADTRMTFGAMYDVGPVNLRGEFAQATLTGAKQDGSDQVVQGYYGIATYQTPISWLKVYGEYSKKTNNNPIQQSANSSDTNRDYIYGANAMLTKDISFMTEWMFSNYTRVKTATTWESVDFNRILIGSRVAF